VSKNYYSLYVESVIKFAATLSIKSAQSADSINTYVAAAYGASSVSTDPTTWKYYLNVCGEYHFSDSQIYITSLDTLQTIPFTKAALASNPATKAAYVYGSVYYQELVAKYPLMQQLIKGVIYPADMASAVAAADGTILSYDTSYVESNEDDLLVHLQDWIYKFIFRWDNPAFRLTDSLYSAARHGIMYLNLPLAILNIRIRFCGTRQAHSFHVRQYLASHSNMDRHYDMMTLEQQLFFYRNIAYLERHSGTNATFETLVQKVLTLRGIPLAEFEMKHSDANMPTNVRADVEFVKKHLNLPSNVAYDETITLTQLLDKEAPLAPGNPDYIAYESTDIDSTLKNSLSGVLPTKVLESAVISYENLLGDDINTILLNHWLYLSTSNQYPVYIRTPNPITGVEIVMSTKQAFLYSVYAYVKAQGLDLTTVPKLMAAKIQRNPLPSIYDMMSVVDAAKVGRSLAIAMLSYHPVQPAIQSTVTFYNFCKNIQRATKAQAGIVSMQEDFSTQSQVKAMGLRVFGDVVCSFAADGTTMTQWLSDNDLPAADAFTAAQYLQLYNDILLKATGQDLVSTQTVADIQAAMVGIMQQLSSYSVQFTTNITGTDVQALKWSTIRFSHPNFVESDLTDVDIGDTKASIASTMENAGMRIDFGGNGVISARTRISETDKVSANLHLKLQSDKDPTYLIRLSRGRIKFAVDPYPVQGPGKTLLGYEIASTLTADQLASIPDVYGHSPAN
jgi:hypothetical protein